jgi:general nucleoside transport system permease protein
MIRLERRLQPSVGLRLATPIVSLAIALMLVAVLLAVTGENPLTTYGAMVDAAFTAPGALSATLVTATPLILTGLCAAIAFRAEIYNVGGEGQLYMGAMAATAVALLMRNSPPYVIIGAMIAAGAVAGGLWALVPAALRVFFGANEILTSLMLNYVAGYFITYLIFDSNSFWRDLSSAAGMEYPTGKTIPVAGWWPALRLGGVDIPFGILAGVALAVGCELLLRRGTLGLKIRITGGSVSTARYSGIDVRRLVIVVMLISGALAGLGGASQVGGFSHLLDPTGLEQAQFGYGGILVAALAGFGPLAVVLSGLFLGAITSAGAALAQASFPVGVIGIIEGVGVLSVVSAAILVTHRVRWQTIPSLTVPPGPQRVSE